MTKSGFAKLLHYLEGAFQVELDQKARDAYWLTLAPDDDTRVFHQAIDYTRTERSRYGFPKPGDLIPPPPGRGEHLRLEAAETARRYGGKLLSEAALTREESAEIVAALKRGDPEPPAPKPIRLSERLRSWRRSSRAPEDAA